RQSRARCVGSGRGEWARAASDLVSAYPSAARFAQRWAVDAQGMALVPQPAEQGFAERLVAEEVVPLVVVEIGGNDRGLAPVPLSHQVEEDVGLLGAQVEVAHLVDDQDTDAAQPVKELSRRAVGERGVHLVEERLSGQEDAAVAVLQRLEQDPRGQPRLADAGATDEPGFRATTLAGR